jgi:hypothetical protein
MNGKLPDDCALLIQSGALLVMYFQVGKVLYAKSDKSRTWLAVR